MCAQSRTIRTSRAAILAAALIWAAPAGAEIRPETVKRFHEAAQDWTSLAQASGAGARLPRLSDPRARAAFDVLRGADIRGAEPYVTADLARIMQMQGDLSAILKAYILAPGADGKPDPAANQTLYQDELAPVMVQMIDLAAASLRGLKVFVATLTPEQMTPIRIAGMDTAKEGVATVVLGGLVTIGSPGFRPENGRMIAVALGRNGAWLSDQIPTAHAAAMRNAVTQLLAHSGDRATHDALATFAQAAGLTPR